MTDTETPTLYPRFRQFEVPQNPIDPEIEMLYVLHAVMEELPKEAHPRVLDWLQSKYGVRS